MTCGTTLAALKPIAPDNAPIHTPAEYDYHYGETDLLEGNLRWRGGTYLFGGLVLLATLACVGVFGFIGIRVLEGLTQPGNRGVFLTPSAVATVNAITIVTNTPRSTLFLATVTPAPPTPSPTATATATAEPGPCEQKVLPNDDLIAIVLRCGHRSLDVIPEVVKLNNLPDSSRIQAGQTILVPWPTPTFDPNQTPTETAVGQAEGGQSNVALAAVNVADGTTVPSLTPTETLQPGVTWHRVQPKENILIVARTYGADLKVLSELNPEITFSQCDFGSGSGGPNCVVMIFEGQLIRVPAPTPAPTLSPTPSGSETPTPTATATFNAPSALSPSDRAFFGVDELITLRWVASGTLGPGQVYQVRLEDKTAGVVYLGTTQQLFFIVPEDWHSQQVRRHDYEWTVSVVDQTRLDQAYFTTQPRQFTWQGRAEKK
jgi:hypothetical protein